MAEYEFRGRRYTTGPCIRLIFGYCQTAIPELIGETRKKLERPEISAF